MIASPSKPPVTPTIRTTSLERGTFLTTDLAMARALFEEVLDLECVRYTSLLQIVRKMGEPFAHRFGEPAAHENFW
jgi:hypothetical protein